MLETKIRRKIAEAFKTLFAEVEENKITLQKTRKDVQGDYTVNVFPFYVFLNFRQKKRLNKLESI